MAKGIPNKRYYMRVEPFEKSFSRRPGEKHLPPGKDAARAHRRQPLQARPGAAP